MGYGDDSTHNSSTREQIMSGVTQKTKQNSPFRILHLVSDLTINSGIMMAIMNYYRHINRKEIQFDFVYFVELDEKATYKTEIESLGGEIFLIPRPTLSPCYISYLHRFFATHKEEHLAIHIHEVYLTFMFASFARIYKLKIITHCHNTKFSDHILHAIRNRILCLGINKNADLRFACSKAAGLALYGKHATFTVINNAIDLNKFAFDSDKRKFIRQSLNIENKTVIGHVGRFNQQKNHQFLVKIFNEFHKTNSDSVLLLIGEGPLMDEVRGQLAKLSLEDSAIFLGRRRDVAELYNAMDVFVFPSLFEGLGIVLIEAQANGLPCVIASCVPQEAIIDRAVIVNLSQSPLYWSNTISKVLCSQRTNCDMQKIYSSGFEIKTEAAILEKKYTNLLNKCPLRTE